MGFSTGSEACRFRIAAAAAATDAAEVGVALVACPCGGSASVSCSIFMKMACCLGEF